jgi:hypothetical protein
VAGVRAVASSSRAVFHQFLLTRPMIRVGKIGDHDLR